MLGLGCSVTFSWERPTSSDTRRPPAKQRCNIARSRSPKRVVTSGASSTARTSSIVRWRMSWRLLFISPNRPGCDSIRLLMADGGSNEERAGFLRFRRSAAEAERPRRPARGLRPGGGFRILQARTGKGVCLFERNPWRPPALRSGDDAEGAGDPDRQQPVGRAHRVPDQRPSVLHAVSRTGPFGPGSRRTHDLVVPGETDEGRRHQCAVRALRRHAARCRLHRHVGADPRVKPEDRFQPRCRTEAEEHERGEGRDQDGPRSRGLERQARETAAEGPRRAGP